MPDKVSKSLHEFKHPPTEKPEHAPSKWQQPRHGDKNPQLTVIKDTSASLMGTEIIPKNNRNILILYIRGGHCRALRCQLFSLHPNQSNIENHNQPSNF